MRRFATAVPSPHVSVLCRAQVAAAPLLSSLPPGPLPAHRVLLPAAAAAATSFTQRRCYVFLVNKSAEGSASAAAGAVSSMSSSESTSAMLSGAATAATSSLQADSSIGRTPLTYFDYMDRFWNRKWFGTVDGAGSAAAADVSSSSATAAAVSDPNALNSFSEMLLSVQGLLGWEAWAVILGFGAATRLFTLFFSFYGERASARMQLALPELKAPQEAFNKVYYNDFSSALDVQLSATALKSERRRVFAKYGTSNLRCIASFASSPFIVYGLYQISLLCENPVLDVGTSSFFWCTALTLPDPFFVLPVVFCGLTLLNFELSISKAMKRGWMSNVIWGMRLGCLCVMPVAATFRSGVCLYFIGMSLAGLLQPLLLRSAAFRSAFGFPVATALTDAQTLLKDSDELQSRMTVQFPYLSHLLNPEVEDDNEHLFKSASGGAAGGAQRHSTGRKISAKSRIVPAEICRYAAGTNPLMRETPINKRTPVDGAATETAAAAQKNTKSKARSASGKGSSFASGGGGSGGGWKSAHVAFSEEDFIPSSFESGGGNSPVKQRSKK